MVARTVADWLVETPSSGSLGSGLARLSATACGRLVGLTKLWATRLGSYAAVELGRDSMQYAPLGQRQPVRAETVHWESSTF